MMAFAPHAAGPVRHATYLGVCRALVAGLLVAQMAVSSTVHHAKVVHQLARLATLVGASVVQTTCQIAAQLVDSTMDRPAKTVQVTV